MWDRISNMWCKRMHGRAMWPIHGKYICPQCLREHAVEWEGSPRMAEYADPSLRPAQFRVAAGVTVCQ